MSVIAVRKTEAGFDIAADSIGTWGNTMRLNGGDKLIEVHRRLFIGGCGMSSINSMMRQFATVHAYSLPNTLKDWSLFAQKFKRGLKDFDLNLADNSFLVVAYGLAWRINDLHVQEILDYDAIGAGRDFALAALFLGKSAAKACEVATNLCHHCAGPIISAEVGR